MNMKQQLDLENYILDTTTTSEILISAHPARKFHRTGRIFACDVIAIQKLNIIKHQ